MRAVKSLLPNLSLVIIDSETISLWEVGHALWPTWRANVDMLVAGLKSCDATALHIACDSDEEIQAAFKKVAAMIGGTREAL